MERWKTVTEFPDYEVSTLGRVRRGSSVLKARPNTGGYPQVLLKQKARRVHRLVAEAFVPNPEGFPHVRHRDGDRTNNVIENLLWGTHADNMQDRVQHGNNPNLNKTHCLRGHELAEPNLIMRKDGSRTCRACENGRQRLRLDPSRDLQVESDRAYARILATSVESV